MKRFYCTVCQKVKRVRRIPPSVTTPNAESVLERVGVCPSHAPGYIKPYRVRIKHVTVTKTAPQQKARRK